MPYVGDSLAPLFRPEPLLAALEQLADAGGDELHDRVLENTPIEFGNLRTSWYRTATTPHRSVLGSGWETMVRTEVSYAPDVEWGTGVYGPKGMPYIIRPKNPDGYLSWIDRHTGERVFAKEVKHPGSPGQHMMAIGAAMTEFSWPERARPVLEEWKREQERLP